MHMARVAYLGGASDMLLDGLVHQRLLLVHTLGAGHHSARKRTALVGDRADRLRAAAQELLTRHTRITRWLATNHQPPERHPQACAVPA